MNYFDITTFAIIHCGFQHKNFERTLKRSEAKSVKPDVIISVFLKQNYKRVGFS